MIHHDNIDYKYGVLGQDGEWILYPEYRRVEINGNRIIAARDTLFALFTTGGQQLTPFIFRDIDLSDYHYRPDHPIPARLPGRDTFIDRLGAPVFPDSCDYMYSDYRDFLKFGKAGNHTVMSLDKKIIFSGKADYILHATEQLFIVYHNHKARVYTYSGKLTATHAFTASPESMSVIHYPYASFESNGLYGIRRVTDGYITVKPKYTALHSPYYDSTTILVEINKKFGLIDFLGNVLIPPVYDRFDFNYKNIFLLKDSMWSIFDHQGKKLTSLGYKQIHPALTTVMAMTNDKWVLFDSMARPVSYEFDAYHFGSRGEKDPWIILKGEKYGMMDWQGKEKIPCIYEELTYSDIHLLIAKENGKYGVIDTNGMVVIPFAYDEIAFDWFAAYAVSHSRNVVIRLKKDNLYGLADTSGKIIFDVKYPYISYDFGMVLLYNYLPCFNCPGILGQIDGVYYHPEKIAVSSIDGKLQTDYKYDWIEHIFPNGAVVFSVDYKYGYLGADGTERWLE